MKSYQVIVLALVVACASAFAPVSQQRTAVSQLAASKLPQQPEPVHDKKAIAMAAFATSLAPLAANAVDESVVIGYGAGLVACIVSLAVGFAIGYGTLVKP